MSKYTTEIRFICEEANGLTTSKGYTSTKEIITNAAPKVFDFDFPIFDEAYRLPLEIKILRHYYTREIGEETVGLWKLRLEDRMNTIMPYFNQLYKSELLAFNPFYDVDYTVENTGKTDGVVDGTIDGNESGTGKVTGNVKDVGNSNVNTTGNTKSSGNDSGTTSNNNNHWDYYNDTPQGGVQGLEGLNYLTNARHVTDSGNGTHANNYEDNGEYGSDVIGKNDNTRDSTENSESSRETKTISNTKSTSTEEYLQRVQGKRTGTTYAKMLEEYRKTFLNIDQMVITELSDLFFGLWM